VAEIRVSNIEVHRGDMGSPTVLIVAMLPLGVAPVPGPDPQLPVDVARGLRRWLDLVPDVEASRAG
jgi:hypothetical protein